MLNFLGRVSPEVTPVEMSCSGGGSSDPPRAGSLKQEDASDNRVYLHQKDMDEATFWEFKK